MTACCGRIPRKGSPEEGKGFKPENNAGCGTGNTGCNSPTRAYEGTPRYEWEEKHGKLTTVFVMERVDIGLGTTGLVRKYRREVCENSNLPPKNNCCAIRYKVIR